MSLFGSIMFTFLLTSSCMVGTIAQQEHEIFNDCTEAHEKSCTSSPRAQYWIKSRTTAGFTRSYCVNDWNGCQGHGWIEIRTFRNDQFLVDTSYDSPLWTTKDTFYAQFWSAKVNEVCLSTGSGDPGFFVQFPVQAPSLRSLLVQKKALNINASVWQRGSVNLLDLNFTEGCYEAGFNVGDPSGIQARIGIVSVAGDGCRAQPPQAIGLGLKSTTTGNLPSGLYHGAYDGEIEKVIFSLTHVFVRSRNISQPFSQS